MRFSRILVTCAIGAVSGLGIAGVVNEGLQAPVSEIQQTIYSTSSVVVVVVPGFPIESVVVGVLLGLALLVMARRRRARKGS